MPRGTSSTPFASISGAHGPFSLFPDQCLPLGDTYLTAYVLDVLRRAEGLGVTHALALERTLEHLERTFDHYLETPGELSRASSLAEVAYVFKVLAEYRRPAPVGAPRLLSHLDRMPVFALSYLADGYAARNERGPVYQDIVRRIQNALRVSADNAFVAEREDEDLRWIWSSPIRSTAIVLEGLSRRRDSTEQAGSMARWLLGQREHGRWPTTQDNISAISALVSYLKAFENDDAPVTASVSVGRRRVGGASLTRQAPVAPPIRLTGNDLNELIGGAIPGTDLSISAGAGRVLYTARLTYEPPDVEEARGVRIARRYSLERDGSPATAFKVGDVVRVTLTLNLHQEGQFLAVTDPLPAGFEPVNESFGTTSSWEARQRLRNGDSTFDHSEQHDDRVLVFARRLGAKPEFTYLVRAVTAGTFTAAGASVEAMYAPEIFGRTTSTTIHIKKQIIEAKRDPASHLVPVVPVVPD
jgi:uncharacterized protein YfaS (alpha-2-macroglobulin family)